MLSRGSYRPTPYVTVQWDALDPGRLQSIIESDSEYWKNIVVEINFEGGAQTSRSTKLEVISCWLHKTRSIDSGPCGSRQIAWLIAMCWKRMPALCILAKMDMQTANSGAVWAWLPCSQQTVDQRSAVPELDLTLALFVFLFGRC